MSGTRRPSQQAGTRQLFAGARTASERASAMTSERIAEDMARFRTSGGQVEVLGTTRTLTRLDETAPRAPAPAGPGRGKR
ncbi:hypothetical protein [Luteimonas deserti]|uniref:Uncharacterized protein n=1 Tax=Luteimonas deserti TaxID=2752306 RepID=A0A7Z0QTQ7_9GAMM|nr:hypothetical protein [Luteimonas deserti]NYZ63288.1 hypothetical protein [Luteimonas deserti]